jgi:hypothetical protein
MHQQTPVQQEVPIHAEQLRSPLSDMRPSPSGNQHSNSPPHFQEARQSSGRWWQSVFSYGNCVREYSVWVERMECG